ncbi:MAG: hypothetical protein KA953_05030 [Lachnospiraceae bacterium]|nr:hypothetical protein [Lachnospiraceae bacterium]
MKKKMLSWVHVHPIFTRCMGCLVLLFMIGFVIWLFMREPANHREYKGNGKATMIDK